jgi:uncharacterized protein (TIGR03086 family)
MTDLLMLHRRAAEAFGARVHAIRDDQWGLPSPCEDWDVRALVRHVVEDNLWVPHLMKGAKIEDIGERFAGDVLGPLPVEAWDRSIAEALEAFAEEDALKRTVHLSFGDVPASVYAEQRTLDLLVHAWDLARAIGADDHLDGTVVAFALPYATEHADELSGSGMFGDALDVPDDADAQTRLLAKLGRQV